jgi:hypothetical protein
MPALVLFLIGILFVTGAPRTAHADSGTEIRMKKGLLVFQDFQQWSNIRYNYSDSFTNLGDSKGTSSSHNLQESYNASISGALYDPHLFKAYLQAGILFDQNRNKNETSSSSGNNAKYLYNFNGVGLDESSTPFSLLSVRDIDTVNTTYSLPYTTDHTGNEIDAAFLNIWLKSRFHIARNTLDIKGGGNDSSSVSNSFSYTGENHYKDFSTTILSLTIYDQTGRESTGAEHVASANSFLLGNTTNMGPQKKYTLHTTFKLNITGTDNVPQRYLDFTETIQARLGKALNLEASYDLANTRLAGLTDEIKTSTQNSGVVTLKHRLFSSLETNLSGRASFNNMNDGTENRYAANGSMRYTKRLPADNRLTAGVSKGYEVVERRLGSANATVVDELHPGVHQGDGINLLLDSGTLRSVISVKSRNPVVTYVENIDYTVDFALGRINISAGSGARIDATGTGTDLYISYIVFKDPLISFAKNVLTASTDLGLLNYKYQIGASYTDERETLISGPPSNSLQDSRSLMAYFGGNHDIFNYRLNYQNVVAGSKAYQAIEGTGRTAWSSSSYSVSLMARDRYNKYDATTVAAGYYENMAEFSLLYIQNILSTARLTLQSNVIDIRSDIRNPRDSMSLRAVYSVELNKTTIAMSGLTAWTLYNGGTTRDDMVNIDISRKF